MDEMTKVKVLLMQEVKDSNLPKGGRIILLNLVAESEDIFDTVEVLEAFGVISREVKEAFDQIEEEYTAGPGQVPEVNQPSHERNRAGQVIGPGKWPVQPKPGNGGPAGGPNLPRNRASQII